MAKHLQILPRWTAFGAVFLASATSYAVGSYQFCTRWAYSYIDHDYGEDYLLHTLGNGSYGAQPAAYAYTEIEKDGVTIWTGLMDAGGCSPPLPGTSGSYVLWTTTDMKIPPNGPEVLVTPTTSQNWRWFYADYGQLPAVNNPLTNTVDFGPGDNTLQAAAAAEALLTQPDAGGLLSGHQYWIYADDPNVVNTGYTPAGVTLAPNPQFDVLRQTNITDAAFKSVIIHELGHGVQDHLFGLQSRDYGSGNDPSVALCQCGHVWDPNDRSHCIQSREESNTAQIEGFAHFIATTAENNSAKLGDVWFPYYKNVLWTDGITYTPPVSFITAAWRWTINNCTTAPGTGNELDWMSFFYWVHRGSSNAFSIAEIGNIYRGVCGGLCTPPVNGTRFVYWNQLRTTTEAIYGVSSPRATLWRNNGTAYGVTL